MCVHVALLYFILRVIDCHLSSSALKQRMLKTTTMYQWKICINKNRIQNQYVKATQTTLQMFKLTQIMDR